MKRLRIPTAIFIIAATSFLFYPAANAQTTGIVQVTCSNGTFGTGWDNSNQYFAGKGNIAALYCEVIHHTRYVSDNLTNESFRYYNGVVPTPDPILTPVVETSTVSVETSTPVVETSTVQSETVTVPSVPDSPTVVVQETVTVVDSQTVETSTPVETLTATETATPIVPVEPEPLPIPIPEPVVIPDPIPAVVEPQPIPQPEPTPPVVVEPTPQEPPLEEQPLEEQPVVEEQPPVEEPSEHPTEEETQTPPVEEPEIPEQIEPTPEPSPQPSVEPEPVIQPDAAPEPPVVVLDNGVILTQEEAAQVELLQNPAELLGELFTNPSAAIAALSVIGMDMSPAAREQSKKVVISAVIAGGIAVQGAGAATYRRRP